MAKNNSWSSIPLKGLVGILDTRSRPSDVPLGGFRWRTNFSCSSESQICRRQGFDALFPDLVNGDHHHQGATRQQITFAFEANANSGARTLFDGTQSRVSKLDETTGAWTDIITGLGAAGTRWRGATLQDYLILTNNNDDIKSHNLISGATADIADLKTLLAVRKALVVVQFNGFIVLMNMEQNGTRRSSRVRWSDLNKPLSYDPGAANSIAGFQDLDYGDDILAAAQMGGALIIYTTRSIWKAFVAADSTTVFGFEKIYSEPRNQARCLFFPNTLVSTGTDHYYMGRDGIYHFNPYLSQPERGDEQNSEFFWAHRATGVIYTKADTKLDPVNCNSPVAEFHPSTRELWFSWASASQAELDNPANNWTLVLNITAKYADVVDAGFTVFTNYRPTSTDLCDTEQVFIGASGRDWALKQIGGVYYRSYADMDTGIILDDLPAETETYTHEGYNSILRGTMPLGFPDREKIVRNVALDADVAEQDNPCLISLRVGTSYGIRDPNEEGPTCPIMWTVPEDRVLECPDGATRAQLELDNLRPDSAIEWPVFQIGRYLYFELTIKNFDGGLAIGGDSCFAKVEFDAMASPKA